MALKLVSIETHNKYCELLKKLRFNTKYIYLYVGCPLNDDHDDYILEYCDNNLHFVKKEMVNGLFGENEGLSMHMQYVYSIDDYNNQIDFFDFLNTFETFFHRECQLYINMKYSNRCDFGLDDIGFVDENGEILCCTLTHEAEAFVSDKINFEA